MFTVEKFEKKMKRPDSNINTYAIDYSERGGVLQENHSFLRENIIKKISKEAICIQYTENRKADNIFGYSEAATRFEN